MIDKKEREHRLEEGLAVFGHTYTYKNFMCDVVRGQWDHRLKVYLLPDIAAVSTLRKEILERDRNTRFQSKRHESGYLGWEILHRTKKTPPL